VGAALCAAIRVTRASTNASPPQKNGGQAHERNTADGTVGGERRRLGFQRRAHCNVFDFVLLPRDLKSEQMSPASDATVGPIGLLADHCDRYILISDSYDLERIGSGITIDSAEKVFFRKSEKNISHTDAV
jgi:hypothetical protein